MPQSSAIFAFVGVAFLVWITQRNELRTYMGFLLGTQAAPQASLGGLNLAAVGSFLKFGAQVAAAGA